jgi:hypothetical protein
MTGYMPTGVDASVVMVSVLEHVGVHAVVKLGVAPAGSPDVPYVTAEGVPLMKELVIAALPDAPWVTVTPPPLLRL